jgi:hypothetical protein
MKNYIEKLLEKFKFVHWDRFTESDTEINFYGWIDRKQDNYKDFLVLTIGKGNWKRKKPPVWFITSSKKYSKKIIKILRHKEKNHLSCKRIENYYVIKNSIHI